MLLQFHGQNDASSAVPVFDPATLNLTLWQRDFTTVDATHQWAGASSAGISGTHRAESGSGLTTNNPVAGPALNGHATADYNALVASCGSRQFYIAPHTTVDIGDVITATQYTVMGLIYIASAPAANATSYLNGTVIAGSARWGLCVTNTGIGVYHFDGALFPYVEGAASSGAWHFFCARFGGGIGAGKVQIDIDSSVGSPTSLANINVLAGVETDMGDNSFNTATTFRYYLADLAALKTAISDATRANYKSYLTSRYGHP